MKSKRNIYFNLYLVPLIFMLFPLTGIFWAGYAMWTLPFSLLFLVGYLHLVYKGETKLTRIIWFYMLVYCGYMTIFENPGMIWFLFFFTNLMIYRFEDDYLSYRFISFLATLSLTTILGSLYLKSLDIQISFIIYSIVILGFFIIFKKARKYERQKEEINQKNAYINLLIVENERNRIGQDLHDTLGHVFATMTIKSELALKQLDRGNNIAVKKELKDLNQISLKSMHEVRSIVQRLQYMSLEDELEELKSLFALSDIDFNQNIQMSLQNLSTVVQSNLVMIIRELANNVIKHAKATQCELRLSTTDEKMTVDMIDNGQGFSHVLGNELHSIKERVSLIKGQVEVISEKSPTHIQVVLTYEKE